MTISVPATVVTVERTVKATPQQVYRAFTNRAELNNWFCNNSFVQAQENGAYVCIWNQEQYTAAGIFKKLEENKAIEMTWRGTWKGDIEAADSIFSITIAEDGDKSIVTLTHRDIAEDSAESYDWQWNKRLDDLKLYLETGALPNIINRVIIGIWPAALSDKRAEELGLEKGHGTLVTNLVPDFGAEKAGIQVNDIIVAIDGNAVTPQSNMNMLVQDKKPDDSVKVTFYRGSEKQTLTMNLSGYPVPDIPESMTALADNMTEQYKQLFKELSAMFEGAGEEAAGKRPAEDEWSAKLVLCHLIYSERRVKEGTAGRITGGQPQHWSGNHDARLQAILDVYPTSDDLLQLLHREMQENVAMWRNFPQDIQDDNTHAVWGEAFGIAGWVQHTQGHFSQIKAAIEAAHA